jgi:hypothetical protein
MLSRLSAGRGAVARLGEGDGEEIARLLTEQDDERAPMVAVVSQTMAAEVWPGQDPVGKAHQEDAGHGGDTGLGLDDLEGRPNGVRGGVGGAGHHSVDDVIVNQHGAEVRDVADDLAGLLERRYELDAYCSRCDRWQTSPLANLVARGQEARRLPVERAAASLPASRGWTPAPWCNWQHA